VNISDLTFTCVLSANGTSGAEFDNIDGGWGRGRGHGRGRGGRNSGGRGGFRGRDREQDSGSYEESSGDMKCRANLMKYVHLYLSCMNMTKDVNRNELLYCIQLICIDIVFCRSWPREK